MKMFSSSVLLIVFCLFDSLLAKNIILQRGNQSFAYETLSEAINNANNGDILYLPPGNFDVTGIQINKGIHIIGAGYHPKTTGAIGQTNISGDLVIVKGADGGSIPGLNISNKVVFGTETSNCEVHNFTISRCYIAQPLWLTFNEWDAITNGSNFTISENILCKGICGGYAENVLVTNNIIWQGYWYPLKRFRNAIFSNNIFFYTSGSREMYNCTFKNNIILVGNLSVSGDNNIFLHNLHQQKDGLYHDIYAVIQSEGNVYIERDKIFIKQ